jgi:hypothetical protein
VVEASALHEVLKELSDLVRREADAGIGDRDGDPVATVFGGALGIDGHGAALGELVGVARKV